MRLSSLPRLMLVTDRRRTRGRPLVDLVARAVEGGVGMVQVRERDLPDDELRALVLAIRDAVPESTRIVVNGSLRVARTMGVGLHLPARFPPAGHVDLGGELLGRSAHDEAEALTGVTDPADYLLLGTLFPTESKPGQPGQGVALIERIRRQFHTVPLFAIGGITVSRIPGVVHSGAHGVAVSSAILADNHPRRVAEAMTLALEVAARV